MRGLIPGVRRGISALQNREYSSTRYCYPHMNELPVPCGAWEPWDRQRQAFYNKHLIFGAVWWLFSCGLAYYTNSLYFNFSPPAQPGPPSDMVDECDDPDS